MSALKEHDAREDADGVLHPTKSHQWKRSQQPAASSQQPAAIAGTFKQLVTKVALGVIFYPPMLSD